MKLNEKYLGVAYETNSFLKNFFLRNHLDLRFKPNVMSEQLMAQAFSWYYDKKITDPWQMRIDIATRLAESPKNLKKYFITKKVSDGADLIKFDADKIDLQMFKVLPNMQCLYITDRNQMYRFEKNDHRINILNYFRNKIGTPQEEIKYESYSIILEDNEMKFGMLPEQNREAATKLLKLLLFIELGETTYKVIKANGGKIVIGKGVEEGKIINDSSIDFTVVNSNWNTITVVRGGFTVRGHYRLQWVGEGRTKVALVFVRPYEKGTFIRGAGKDTSENKE